MFKWLHHLFNPHCTECADELNAKLICNTCEYLKTENARLQLINSNLTERLLNANSNLTNKPVESGMENDKPLEVINPSQFIPWRVKRQTLEENARAEAKVIADKKAEAEKTKVFVTGTNIVPNHPGKIEELEKEIFNA